MARSRNRGTRDDMSIANVSLRSPILRATRLTGMDDRRTFDFEPATRPARLFTGSTASVTVTPTQPQKQNQKLTRPNFNRAQLAFSMPGETLICIRRKRRKEVLFAKRKTGKGGQRRPRRSAYSDTKC